MATLKNPGLCICFMAAYPPRGIGQNEQSPRQIDSNFGFYGLTGVLPGEQASEASHFPYIPTRSEEDTSELQSLMRNSYAVFCLKKQRMQQHKITNRDQH